MKAPTIIASAALLLSACASSLPADQLTLTRSILTSELATDTFARRDRTHFRTTDSVRLITIVRWPDLHASAGRHVVRWQWYRGDTPLAAVHQQVEMIQTPYELYGEIPARELGPGEHHVECFVEDVMVDRRSFVVED
jgi:hypothetical protein